MYPSALSTYIFSSLSIYPFHASITLDQHQNHAMSTTPHSAPNYRKYSAPPSAVPPHQPTPPPHPPSIPSHPVPVPRPVHPSLSQFSSAHISASHYSSGQVRSGQVRSGRLDSHGLDAVRLNAAQPSLIQHNTGYLAGLGWAGLGLE